MTTGPGSVAELAMNAIRDVCSFDLGVETSNGSVWVVLRADLGGAEIEMGRRPDEAAVLFADLRGGVTPEGVERAKAEAGRLDLAGGLR